MKNKLLEAIQKGISNGLSILIDNDDDDIIIKKHNVNSKNNYSLYDYYIDEILNGNMNIRFNQLYAIYQKDGKKYKVTDFDRFSSIFNALDGKIGFNLDWVDTSDVISLILENQQEISFNEYDPNKHIVNFIKFKNNFTGHDIILLKSLLKTPKIQWNIVNYENEDENVEIKQSDYFDYNDCIIHVHKACLDYNGAEHTFENANDHDTYENNYFYESNPAIATCIDLCDLHPNYDCYLPALGELRFISENIDLINFYLKKIGVELQLNNCDIWSSTELDAENAWILSNNRFALENKWATQVNVLPMFQKRK